MGGDEGLGFKGRIIVAVAAMAVLVTVAGIIYKFPRGESIETHTNTDTAVTVVDSGSDKETIESDTAEEVTEGDKEAKKEVDGIKVSSLEENQKDLGINLVEMSEKARLAFNKRVAGRDVDKDALVLYTANYMIVEIYKTEKAKSYYESKAGSTDNKEVVKVISDDVAEYLNKERDK